MTARSAAAAQSAPARRARLRPEPSGAATACAAQGQASVVPAKLLDLFGLASNTARIYVCNYRGSDAMNTNLDTSASTLKVDFSAKVWGLAQQLAVSPGNVYAAVSGFPKSSTTGLVGEVQHFVQRIHLASKTLAYYEIPRPASTTMACSENGLSVNDSGEVVVGTAQTTSGFSPGR